MDPVLASVGGLLAAFGGALFIRGRARRPPPMSERDVADHIYGRRPS